MCFLISFMSLILSSLSNGVSIVIIDLFGICWKKKSNSKFHSQILKCLSIQELIIQSDKWYISGCKLIILVNYFL
jgi:uncharacterized membrane protein YqgA involved in biofilm formation